MTNSDEIKINPGGGSLPYTAVIEDGGYGWSDYYTVNVQFYSGYELGESADNYSRYHIFAIIKWNNGGYSTIVINRWVTSLQYITENEVEYNNATGESINTMYGMDKVNTLWQIDL